MICRRFQTVCPECSCFGTHDPTCQLKDKDPLDVIRQLKEEKSSLYTLIERHGAVNDYRQRRIMQLEAKIFRQEDENWQSVPKNIHPLSSSTECSEIFNRLKNPPAPLDGESELEWFARWWKYILEASPQIKRK